LREEKAKKEKKEEKRMRNIRKAKGKSLREVTIKIGL